MTFTNSNNPTATTKPQSHKANESLTDIYTANMDADGSTPLGADDSQDSTSDIKDTEVPFNSALQAELDRYKSDMAAMQQEFNHVDEDDSPAAVKRSLIAAAPSAIQKIISLSQHGDSDGICLNASKYIVDVALGKVKIEAGSDGFDNLIKGLMQETEDQKKAKAKAKAEAKAKAIDNKTTDAK